VPHERGSHETRVFAAPTTGSVSSTRSTTVRRTERGSTRRRRVVASGEREFATCRERAPPSTGADLVARIDHPVDTAG
jgi:hypothetical protein